MIDPYLQAFLTTKVDPEPDVVAQASESQKRLRNILASKLEAGEDLPAVLEGCDFLFGSAIRGTQPTPFDDIDLMLVLDGSALVAREAGQVVGTVYGSGESRNVVLTSPYLDPSGHVSSQKIMNRIRAVLAETYTRSTIRKDGQAINVWMESYGFGIDVVPAFKIYSTVHGDHYYIPVGTGSDQWRSTNPHADLTAFEAEDVRLGGLLRQTSRLMRKWNELSNGGRLSGFHVDALVYRSLYGKAVYTLEIAILTCIESFEALLGAYCPQFSGFQPHIDQHLDSEERNRSIAAIQSAKRGILVAGTVRGSAESLAAWNSLFGDDLI